MTQAVLIVGATGLIGTHLATQLVEQGRDDGLHILARRSVDRNFGQAQIHVAPNDNWPDIIEGIKPEIIVSCLGTTMKKAGSKAAFAAIDRDLVVAVAKAARAAGADRCLAVSSTMADSSASSYYLKVKGQAEDALRAQNFARLDLIRPGLLRGERTDDPRLGESLAILASPVMDLLLRGSLRRYRSIKAEDVAAAIAALMQKTQPGAFVHENDQIWNLTASNR